MKKIYFSLITAICTAFMAYGYISSVSAENIDSTKIYVSPKIQAFDADFDYKSHFIEKDGKTYCISNEGKMLSGNVIFYDKFDEPHYFLFLKDGSMYTGFIHKKENEEVHTYYYIEDKTSPKYGELFTGGEIIINGNDYYFESGGWYKHDGWLADKYYKKRSGKLKNRPAKINGIVYLFNEDGQSVPKNLSDAIPSEFSFLRLGENADKEALRCGIGNITNTKGHSAVYIGSYKGNTIIDGKKSDIQISFDCNKNIESVYIKVKGDHFDYFYDYFNEIYGKRNKTETISVRYAQYYKDYEDAHNDGDIGGEEVKIRYEYENNITDVAYQYIYVEEID